VEYDAEVMKVLRVTDEYGNNTEETTRNPKKYEPSCATPAN
jgi:hypothetical protein